jgi:hypothetical protein
MKNKLIFAGMLALVLVFGLIICGCPTDSDDGGGGNIPAKFEGTWKHRMDELNAVYVFTGNKWEFSSAGQQGVATGPFSGTFTYTDTTMTLTVSSGGSGNWTYSYTLEDDTLTLSQNTGNIVPKIVGIFIKQ